MLIALTGYGQAEDFDRSRDAGFDHHFVKPADLKAIQAAIDSASSDGTSKTTHAGAHGHACRTGSASGREAASVSRLRASAELAVQLTAMARALAPATKPVFAGDTEMARRMRALDWASTPLGPVEHWPPALLTSVSICLDCAFPIFVWWGPELVILYNDEYVPVLGPAKHPAALGQPAAKVWAEIWHVIGPMIAQVHGARARPRARATCELHLNREGYPEEAYFSFSYSPIYDEHGRVGGVFCPCIETTEKVIGERRLTTLRDLAAQCKGSESETGRLRRGRHGARPRTRATCRSR